MDRTHPDSGPYIWRQPTILKKVLLRVSAPHFVAGAVCADERVETTAPILKYMKTWTLREVEEYCEKKGWQLEAEEIS